MQLLDISYVSTKSRPNSEFDEHFLVTTSVLAILLFLTGHMLCL